MQLGSIGPVELLLIVLAIAMIFGARKLGDLGGALGKSVKDFKKATKDDEAAARPRAGATVLAPRTGVISPQSPPAAPAPAEPRAPTTTSLGVGDYHPLDGRVSESRPGQK